MSILKTHTNFQWDSGNKEKNFDKHGISNQEAEEVFLDKSNLILEDKLHSDSEIRHIVLGQTKNNQMLSVAFTLRKECVRIISARPMSRKERNIYKNTRRDNEEKT